ncbi:44397_t:CDS:2, partial [Gigaspora margarita]
TIFAKYDIGSIELEKKTKGEKVKMLVQVPLHKKRLCKEQNITKDKLETDIHTNSNTPDKGVVPEIEIVDNSQSNQKMITKHEAELPKGNKIETSQEQLKPELVTIDPETSKQEMDISVDTEIERFTIVQKEKE